ncbi:MAG: FkbM family methyltransferase [Nitrospirae bacterium]|nr:FkbM family methyltransferase [Nitrospirota bacterium]
MKGCFINAYVGSKYGKHANGKEIISIDYLMDKYRIDFVHVAHADIQGAELDMLHGASRALSNKKIGYFVISTHSNELHEKCISFLKDHKFILIASANIDETYSYDGLVVMRAPYFEGINPVNISQKGH